MQEKLEMFFFWQIGLARDSKHFCLSTLFFTLPKEMEYDQNYLRCFNVFTDFILEFVYIPSETLKLWTIFIPSTLHIAPYSFT